MATTDLSAGFADPPQQAARAFRAALEAMARPGSLHALPPTAPPAGISPAAAALLLALVDAETPLWMAPRLRSGPVPAWVRFHTNAPPAERAAAAFALGRWEDLLPLEDWPAGTPANPERSTTLLVEVEALEGGPELVLSGPGIAGTRRFAPMLPPGAVLALGANAARFPLGIDLCLLAGTQMAALPRTTRIGG